MNNREAIAIIDVGLGNIASIQRMIEKAGGKAVPVIDPDQLHKGDKVILPGVGHYDEGMSRLTETGFADILVNLGKTHEIHVLGICLGMQLLCRGSEEGGLPGLGLIDADVMKFRFPAESNLKVPHMGWNHVDQALDHPLWTGIPDHSRFYFVHSYWVDAADSALVAGTFDYGVTGAAALARDNLFAVQFHPEKSHDLGLRLLSNFLTWNGQC